METFGKAVFSLLVLVIPITLLAGPTGGQRESDLPGPIADFLDQVAREFEHAKYQYIPSLSLSQRGRPIGYEIPVYSNVQGPVGEYVLDWAMRRGLYSPWWDIKQRSLENIDTIPAKGFKSVGFYQKRILKKNLYAIGTPDNFLIHHILRESLGKQIRLENQRIIIRDEIFTGENLVLKVIVPNPFEPQHYALLIAATSEAALLNLEDLNEDQYDLALYRGKRLLATGNFDRKGKNWTLKPLGIRRQNWSIEQYGPLTQHSRTGRFLNPEWILERMRAVATFLRLPEEEEIRLFVYPTLKEKVLESGDRNYTHLDLAGGAIHTAAARGDALGPFITEILIYRKFGMTGGPVLRLGFAAAINQLISVPRTCEEHERNRLGALTSIKTSLENGRGLEVEKLGILIRYLINRDGFVRFEQFFSGVDGAFARRFENFYGSGPVEFEGEIDSYLETGCRKAKLASMAATVSGTEEKNPHELLQTGISSFLEENYFRAEQNTRLALAGAGWKDHELRSWVYFNLGRSLAMTGNIPEARNYLDLSVHLEGKPLGANGERATVASRHWLGSLGKSQNFNERVRQALVDSKNALADFEWEKAVRRLDEALSVDSGNPDGLLLRSKINRERHTYLQQKIEYLNQSNPVGPLIDLTLFDRFREEAIHDQKRAGTLLLEDAVQSKTEGYLNLQRFLEEFKEQNRSGEWKIDSLGRWLEKAESSFSKHLVINIDGVRFRNPQARTGIGITRIYRSKIARLEGRMKSSRDHLEMAGYMLGVIIPNRTAEPGIRDQARTYMAYSEYLLARFHTADADEKISLYREAVRHFEKSLRNTQIGPQFKQYTRKGLMKTLTYLGFEEFELDRFKQSKKHFHRALEIIEENFPEMELWERLVNSNLVEVEERLGNPN